MTGPDVRKGEMQATHLQLHAASVLGAFTCRSEIYIFSLELCARVARYLKRRFYAPKKFSNPLKYC